MAVLGGHGNTGKGPATCMAPEKGSMPPLPCRALLAACKSVIVAAAATSALLPLQHNIQA